MNEQQHFVHHSKEESTALPVCECIQNNYVKEEGVFVYEYMNTDDGFLKREIL